MPLKKACGIPAIFCPLSCIPQILHVYLNSKTHFPVNPANTDFSEDKATDFFKIVYTGLE